MILSFPPFLLPFWSLSLCYNLKAQVSQKKKKTSFSIPIFSVLFSCALNILISLHSIVTGSITVSISIVTVILESGLYYFYLLFSRAEVPKLFRLAAWMERKEGGGMGMHMRMMQMGVAQVHARHWGQA